MKHSHYVYTIVFLLLGTLFFSCKTVQTQLTADSRLKAAVNYASPEATLKILSAKDGTITAELTSPYISAFTLRGTVSNPDEKTMQIVLNECSIWSHTGTGWISGTSEIYGIIRVTESNGICRIEAGDIPEFSEVKKAKIRYSSNLITGSKAVLQLEWQLERIRSVNEFLKQTGKLPDYFSHSWMFDRYDESYQKKIKDILMPELTMHPVLKNNEFKPVPGSPGYIITEDTAWNIRYTETVFPQHLKPLRNTGVMRKDFEEAFPIMFSDYNFVYFWTKKLGSLSFIKK